MNLMDSLLWPGLIINQIGFDEKIKLRRARE
jgi:hypothetical protein